MFFEVESFGNRVSADAKKPKRAHGSEACQAKVFVTDGGKNIFCLVEAFVVEKGAVLLWSISFQ